jgi:phosphate starvation-inducible PhoH-like protein
MNGNQKKSPRAARSQEQANESMKTVSLRQNQKKYLDTILENDITFCYGPAGTSKTFTACYAALELLKKKEIKRIILCKPIQEAGEKLGFLPGTVDEKVEPYLKSYRSSFEKIVGFSASYNMFGSKMIEFQPLAYMRGDTFDDALMILDEAQNADFKQLMLFVTRMGQNSKVIVAGDVSQYDIAKNKVALPAFMKLMTGVKGVGTHVFGETDIVRAKILQEIVHRYEKWKDENEK